MERLIEDVQEFDRLCEDDINGHTLILETRHYAEGPPDHVLEVYKGDALIHRETFDGEKTARDEYDDWKATVSV